MEAIDVLGDDGRELTLALEPSERIMCRVGLGLRMKDLFAIELEKLVRVIHEKAVAEHLLRRDGCPTCLTVEPIAGAEIRNAAFGGDSRAAHKHDALAFGEDLAECAHVSILGGQRAV